LGGLKQGFKLVREWIEHRKKTVEMVHGITSQRPEQADAKRLLELTRGYWGIETELHHKPDVNIGEDATRVRKGVAPQVKAALLNSVLHALSAVPAPSRASAMRTMGNWVVSYRRCTAG
jgi:hypothetical protein